MTHLLLIILLLFLAFMVLLMTAYSDAKRKYTTGYRGGSSHKPITNNKEIDIDFIPLKKKEDKDNGEN